MVIVTGLILKGVLGYGMSESIASRLGLTAQPQIHVASLTASVGQGIALGVLGGFRALAANFFWLRVQDRWEAKDIPGTLRHLHLTCMIDPRPLTFWLNGARMIAYDLPAWRIAERIRDARSAEIEARQIKLDQAHAALAWLREAERSHPRSPAIRIEQANLYLNGLHDLEAAALGYRAASELAGAPFYAARLHAELLRRLGRKREAYEWLVKIHPTLPPDNAAAACKVVLARLRALEDELAVPDEQRYRSP